MMAKSQKTGNSISTTADRVPTSRSLPVTVANDDVARRA
jgi:hypothetical protein